MTKYEELKTLVASVEVEAKKFYEKGNAAAGTRVRKLMQDVKNKAQEIRFEVSEKKSAE